MMGKKILIVFLFLGAIFVTNFFSVSAQNKPQIIATWTASSYAPSNYPGKVLPSVGSSVFASFEALSGGKVLNLSKQMIYWYLNDNLVASGEGVQDVTFKAVQSGVVNLRIQASSAAGIINHSIVIVVVDPEVAIGGVPPGGLVPGNAVQLEARPYFFNVGDISALDLAWKVNGKTPKNSENPRFLNITLGEEIAAGLEMNVSLTAKTRGVYPEAASRSIKLLVEK